MDNMQQELFAVVQKFSHILWNSALEEMTQAEYMTMSAIACMHKAQADRPGVYVSALADYLKISVSMASKSLKALEEKGWIQRTVDPKSRRNTFVSLTEAGANCLSEELARTCEVNRQVFARMGQERMDRFIEDAGLLASYYAEVLGTK